MKLTREEIMALTPEQLRVAIAKAKGLNADIMYEGIHDYWGSDGYRYFVGGLSYEPALPNWTTDIADAWELVADLPDDNARHEYTKALIWVINRNYDDVVDQRYQLIHATPMERSRAWLIWKTEAK